MKTIFLALAFLVSAQSVLACSNPEAQFIGKVTEYKKVGIDQYNYDCSFKIDFTSYQASGVCPLDSVEASQTEFIDTQCSLKNGDEVSGYLVVKNGQIVIE